jgi:hypothetical protein
MIFSKFSNKVAAGHGFSSLQVMDQSVADMEICWGNGFENEHVIKVFDEIVYTNDVVNRDADELVYYLYQTDEGAKRLTARSKTFGGADKLANSLIRVFDGILSPMDGKTSSKKMDRFINSVSGLVDGQEIPFEIFKKPNYITDVRFWSIITQNIDIAHVLKCLEAKKMGAARYFIESKTGPFLDSDSMEKWRYPQYIHATMEIPEQIRFFKFLASHIGERLAFIKIVDRNTSNEPVSPLIRRLAQLGDLSHWKQVFFIEDCAEFFNAPSSRVTPMFVSDLLASSVSARPEDIEQLSGLSKSTLERMIDRRAICDKAAMLLAGKSRKLRGMIIDRALGM